MRRRAGTHGLRFSQTLPLLLGSLAVLLLAKAPRKLVEPGEHLPPGAFGSDAPVAVEGESSPDAPGGASSGESSHGEERQALLALRESLTPRSVADTAGPDLSGHGHAAHPDRAAPRADRLHLGALFFTGGAISPGRAPPPFAPRAPPLSV